MRDELINRTSSGKTAPVTPTNASSTQAQEEKRQAVRKLIESIPTKKEDLFNFSLDWSLLDSVCISIIYFLKSNFFFFLRILWENVLNHG